MDHSIKSLSLKFMILVLENEGKSKYFMQSHAAAAFKNTLQLINESSESAQNFSETLYALINDNLEQTVDQVVYDFHKSFRQRDMSNSGYLDMIIWNLLQINEVFETYKSIVNYLFKIVKNKEMLIKENESEVNYVKRLAEDYDFNFI